MIFNSYDMMKTGILDREQIKALMRDIQCVSVVAMSNQKGEALEEARKEMTMMLGPQMAAMMSGQMSQDMDMQLHMEKHMSMQEVPEQEVSELVKELDADRDGVVSKRDFLMNAKKTLFDPNPPEEVMQAMEAMEAMMGGGMPMGGGVMIIDGTGGMMGGMPMMGGGGGQLMLGAPGGAWRDPVIMNGGMEGPQGGGRFVQSGPTPTAAPQYASAPSVRNGQAQQRSVGGAPSYASPAYATASQGGPAVMRPTAAAQPSQGYRPQAATMVGSTGQGTQARVIGGGVSGGVPVQTAQRTMPSAPMQSVSAGVPLRQGVPQQATGRQAMPARVLS